MTALFDADDFYHWRDLWTDMPAFASDDEKPHDDIKVQFSNAADRRRFLQLLGEDPARRKTIWFPSVGYLQQSERNAAPTTVPPNRYPIYVISKGRAADQLTSRSLTKLGIRHHIVIEPPEEDEYSRHNPGVPLYVLPFHDLGQGSVPARNWVWQHARASGAARHWILDDNMDGFYRLNNNLKTKVVDENPFASVEDWTDRYQNVPMAGLNYEFFADRRSKQPPLRLNTRVYSCILLTNTLPDYEWRGRYNEDTDLSLRFLKAGYVTALFNHYLCKKMPTMTMTGGNTDELYVQDEETDGRRLMAESLVEQHPDVATVSQKWGRYQHHVNYSRFQANQLIPADGAPRPSIVAAPAGPTCLRCKTVPVDGQRICPDCLAVLDVWTTESAARSVTLRAAAAEAAEEAAIVEAEQDLRLKVIHEAALEQGRLW
jgi:hypothetical protein